MEKASQNNPPTVLQKHIVSREEAGKIIDTYFDKLGSEVEAYIKQAYPIKSLMLKTADDQNLDFPEDIQETSQIEVGTGPVKIDGKLADGKFTMPDGVILEIKEGKVKKIIQPTPEQIAAKMKADVAKIRKEMADMKAHLKNIIVRSPYKAKAKKTVVPGAPRIPFRKTSF